MRLLWMKSDYVIPPDSGGKIRTYNLLRELNRICDVTYLSYKSDRSPNTEPEIKDCAARVLTVHLEEEVKRGFSFYARVIRRMTSRLPYILQKYRSRRMLEYQRSFLRDQAKNCPNVVLCDFLEMTENVDWSLPCPKVLFQHNVESKIWERYAATESNPLKRAYFGFESRRMKSYESKACNRFDMVFTVSQNDKSILQEDLGVRTPIEVLETGVDTEYFKPQAEYRSTPGRLVFLGSMDWMPNIDGVKWFVNDVYPRIKLRCPHATLDVVGRRPDASISRLPANDHSIRVLADVPDVRPHIADGEVFIVPLRVGGGSRIKIYEAMAMQRPVASTKIGAEGLPLDHGTHIAIGDTPADLSCRICDLLEHGEKREAMAQAGHQLVAENYDWKRVAVKLRDHCLQLAN